MTTREEIRYHLEDVWAKKQRKIDWLGLEHTLRDILRAYKNGGQYDAWEALAGVDEALAAYTGRGNELFAVRRYGAR